MQLDTKGFTSPRCRSQDALLLFSRCGFSPCPAVLKLIGYPLTIDLPGASDAQN